jgi:hypothetical protein
MAILLMSLLMNTGEHYREAQFPDSVEFAGVFAGYEMGDYYYAVFIDDEGYLQTAFPPGGATPGLDVFLFRHRGQRITVTVANRQFDLYGAGYQIVPVVIDAWTAEENYTEWYAETCGEYGIDSIAEFHEVFGDPIETEELFDADEYMNGSD